MVKEDEKDGNVAKEQAPLEADLRRRQINLDLHKLDGIEGARVATGEDRCPVGTSNAIFNTAVVGVARGEVVAGDGGVIILRHDNGVVV